MEAPPNGGLGGGGLRRIELGWLNWVGLGWVSWNVRNGSWAVFFKQNMTKYCMSANWCKLSNFGEVGKNADATHKCSEYPGHWGCSELWLRALFLMREVAKAWRIDSRLHESRIESVQEKEHTLNSKSDEWVVQSEKYRKTLKKCIYEKGRKM